MANLSIRKLDDDVIKMLRLLAAYHNLSMEEEVRQILIRAVSAPKQLGDLANEIFGQDNGVDLELPEHPPHDPLDFSE